MLWIDYGVEFFYGIILFTTTKPTTILWIVGGIRCCIFAFVLAFCVDNANTASNMYG
jgi:hypothetical protein